MNANKEKKKKNIKSTERQRRKNVIKISSNLRWNMNKNCNKRTFSKTHLNLNAPRSNKFLLKRVYLMDIFFDASTENINLWTSNFSTFQLMSIQYAFAVYTAINLSHFFWQRIFSRCCKVFFYVPLGCFWKCLVFS